MSVLRKKYFSLQSNSFVDIPTVANQNFSSLDIGASYNEETIRLVKFGDNVDSSQIDQTFIDLLHNDKKLFDEYQKINSLISNGSFYNVGDNFEIYNVKIDERVDGDYIKSFGIKSGQIKYNDEIIFLEPSSFYSTVKSVASGSTKIIELNSTDIDIQNNISQGSIIFGSEFRDGTQVVGITGTSVELSQNLKSNYTLASGSVVLFMDIPTFEIGKEIDTIGDYSNYEVYRRDLISYNIQKSQWEILKGTEVIQTIPPINTQLDVIYQIESIVYVSGTTHQVKVKKSNRSITNDFSIGDFLNLVKTDNKTFDGSFEILSLDSVNYTINIKIPLYRDNSKNQVIAGGYVDLKTIGVLSVLLYKTSDSSTSVVIDSIKNITSIAGITGGVQNIIKAPINEYNSYFYIKTNDFVHLTDIKGRLLDWEDGQGIITSPVIGYSYNEDTNNDTYLKVYDETSVPQPHYANIDTGKLTNIPFILTNIQNNVFGLNFVDLISFNLGIRNNPTSIGQEGITYKISTYPQLSDPLTSTNVNSIIQNNQKVTTITNVNLNFNSFGITVLNEGSDFILISSGQGYLQIGKIIEVQRNYIQVTGLYKDITTSSQFIIFKNQIQDVTNSSNYITSDNIKSQVLSGINGTFGDQNSYSKVSLEYTDLNNIPKINSSTWYFLSLKGYNDITNPQQQGTPYIVTESLISNNNDASSSFVEVYYRTVTGKYPGDSFKIEDEFGDISTQYNDRSQAPHFRPTKYQVIARSLDEKINYSQDEDEVFVDVHIGAFKFHPDAIPRRVFVSYNKYDVIDGNSTDFSIKHVDVSDTLKINLQDKISDIDYKFNEENEIKKSWKINGLISDENFGFTGPFDVDINDSYNIVYKDSEFTNFSFDEEKYLVKFSNHLYDTPIYVGKNNVLLENISLEKDSISTEDFTTGQLISDFSFLDYSENYIYSPTGTTTVYASGSTLPFVGINFYDESFVPTNDGFYSSLSDFYKKKLIFENPIENSKMVIDDGLYDLDYSIDSKWNYLYPAPFEKNMMLYGLLRKNNYEFLSNINCNLDVKRRLKQREFIKLLDKDLNDLNSNKSTTKIISEKYLSKSLVLDSTRYKENLLYLKTETIKYKPYEFINAQNLQGQNLGLSNVTYPLTGFSSSTIKRSTVYINDSVITAFISPDNSRPKIKIIKFIKSEETSDIGAQSTTTVNEVIVDTISCNEVRICKFNENYFAVAYVSLLTLTSGQNYYIKIKLFDINGVQLTDSETIISPDLPIISPFIFEINNTGLNRIGIVFQRSITEIGLITYYYYPTANVPRTVQTDIKIIDSDNTLTTYPSICKFSKDSFLVAYSNIFGSKIKIFDQEGKLQFFDDSTAVSKTIDYRTITNNNITVTGNIINVIELDNNDIAILYLDKEIFEQFSLKLVILDHWTKRWKYPINDSNTSKTLPSPIFIESGLTEKIDSISMSVLNEDIFIVSYIKAGKIILKAFFNDGGELYNSFEDSLVTGASLINLNTVGQSTLIATYMQGNTYKYSVYNFRPSFTKNIIQNTNFELSSSYTADYFFKNILLDNNNYLFISQTTSTNYNIKVVSTINKTTHSINSSYNSLDFSLSGTTPKIEDIFFLNQDNLKLIFILWANSSNVYLEFFKVDGFTIKKSTQRLDIVNSANYSKNFGKIISIADNILGIILLNTSDKKYHIHGVNYNSLKTSSNFGATDTTKYTNSASTYYNPTLNVLSGVNAEYDVAFYRKDNVGYLISPTNNETRLNFLNFSSDFSGTLNFTNLFTVTPYSLNLNSSRQYSKINFTADKIDNNKIFVIGNSTGSLHFFDIQFSINNAGINEATSSSGTYYSASGTGNQILDEPQIFNSSYDDGLVLFYTNVSGGSNYHNVSFINKQNNTIVDSTPKRIFNETSLGNKFFVQKSGEVDDFYSVFISNNKLYSKTLTLPFTDNIEYERVLKAEQNRNRLYTNNSIKVGGINWKGIIVKNYPIYSIDSFNLDSSQIDDDGIFRSEMMFISAHLVSISKDSFTVVYYYQKDKSDQIFMKLRNFVISRSRIFPDSDWYENTEIRYEGNNKNIDKNIYLQSIEYDNNILNVWVDPITKKINKNLVDSTNQIVNQQFDLPISQPENSNWILLGSSKLIEGWSTVLGYELISNKFYTMLFNPDGNLHRLGTPFNNLPFNIKTATRSNVSINKFGYFSWLYIDLNKNLRYYQHGFDGDPWGTSQIVGRNYITNIQTSSNSPIFNEIKSDILKAEEIKFLQYNRVDINILNNNSIDIYDIYGSQETGLYRIFNLNDPTLNITMGIKVTNGEPIISIDTSSSIVSNISNTIGKFNIFISPSTNYVTFQNSTGENLKLRFYKEN